MGRLSYRTNSCVTYTNPCASTTTPMPTFVQARERMFARWPLEDMKADIKRNMEAIRDRRVDEIKSNSLLEQLVEKYQFDLPKSMVQAELDHRWRMMAQQFGTTSDQLDKLNENTAYFRRRMTEEGFDIPQGVHPIVPVMLYDAKTAQEFARRMLEKGVYVVAFCYPVVPKGKDRIRTQISAGHTKEDLDFAVKCFGEVKAEMGL